MKVTIDLTPEQVASIRAQIEPRVNLDYDDDPDRGEPPIESDTLPSPLWVRAARVWEVTCCRGLSDSVGPHITAFGRALDGLRILAPTATDAQILEGFKVACERYMGDCEKRRARPVLRFFLDGFAAQWAPEPPAALRVAK